MNTTNVLALNKWKWNTCMHLFVTELYDLDIYHNKLYKHNLCKNVFVSTFQNTETYFCNSYLNYYLRKTLFYAEHLGSNPGQSNITNSQIPTNTYKSHSLMKLFDGNPSLTCRSSLL